MNRRRWRFRASQMCWRISLSFGLLSFLAHAQSPANPAADPEIKTVFPLGWQKAKSVEVEIQGQGLEGAYAVWFDRQGVEARVEAVEAVEPEPRHAKAPANAPEKDAPIEQRLRARFDLSGAELGPLSFRVVTPRGVSNSLSFQVSSHETIRENADPKRSVSNAQHLTAPVVVNGRIGEAGELDYYSFDASAGQSLVFEIVSRTGQPELTLYQKTGSWFDPERLTRLAVNYEPTSTRNFKDAALTHRFAQAGRYFLVVAGDIVVGGDTPSYQLFLRPAAPGGDDPKQREALRLAEAWKERSFLRNLPTDRVATLWGRTVVKRAAEVSVETQGTGGDGKLETLTVPPHLPSLAALDKSLPIVKEGDANDAISQALEVPIPSIIEGRIEKPGDVDSFRFQVKAGDSLAFEIETPQTEPPWFNPRLGIIDEHGAEFVTNIYLRTGRAGLSYVKTPEPKTVYTFKLAGTYWLQMQDVTSRYGDPSFAYRALIRPQVPHAGELRVREDRVNLLRGEAKKLRLDADQEEGFAGDILFSVEGLPPGVESFAGAEVEPDRGGPEDEGEKGRFRPKTDKVAILLRARPDSPLTELPHLLRVVARPVVQGAVGEVLQVAEIPLMVVDPAANNPQGAEQQTAAKARQ